LQQHRLITLRNTAVERDTFGAFVVPLFTQLVLSPVTKGKECPWNVSILQRLLLTNFVSIETILEDKTNWIV
jgi:hypothetical protein